MKAVRMGAQTLMGLPNLLDYPVKLGNNFTVFTDEQENKQRTIINVYAENLEKLIDDLKIAFPIDILPVGTDKAVIVDSRVPSDWHYA